MRSNTNARLAYLARSTTAFSTPFFLLVARVLRRHTAFVIPSSSSLVPHTQQPAPSFRLSLSFSFSDTHVHVNAYIFALSLSFSLSFLHSRSHCVEKRSMRAPRYYVMPADRGSDILCMLMPHNVGFVPLFSVYLLGSPPEVRSLLSRTVCVYPVPRFLSPSDIALVRFRRRDVQRRDIRPRGIARGRRSFREKRFSFFPSSARDRTWNSSPRFTFYPTTSPDFPVRVTHGT